MHNEFMAALAGDMAPLLIPAEDDIYGWLLGSWQFDWFYHKNTPQERCYPGEWHFERVLHRHIIQDVFICPARKAALAEWPAEATYGTTIRQYDPQSRHWNVIWVSKDGIERFIAKRDDSGNIVQECVSCTGYAMRWVFSHITPYAFHWSNMTSQDGGASWNTMGELFAIRVDPASSSCS